MLAGFSNKNESSNHFEAFFEHATLGIIVIDSDGLIVAINPFAIKEFGYQQKELLLGQKIEILIPKRYSDRHIHHRNTFHHDSHNRAMGEGIDLLALRKDGTEFPVEISLDHYTTNGCKYVVAFVLNISNRKKTLDEIGNRNSMMEDIIRRRTGDLQSAMQLPEKSNARLENVLSFQKALLDTAGVMIIATDEKGIIRLFNPEAEKKLGYTQQEILNKKKATLFHTKNDIKRTRRELQKTFGIKITNPFDVLVEKARRNIHEEEHYDYINKSGELFPVSLIVTALRDSKRNIIGFMGVAMDISQRIRAEKELKNAKQLFLQLLHNYPDGAISIIDKDFCFVYTGGKLHQRLHANIDQLIGKEMYPLFPQPLRKILFERLEKVFTDGMFISNFELPYPIKNRTYIMDAFPLIEEDGAVNNIGVIIKNISKIKKAEENLLQALRKERLLGELKSRFVSTASHEFRTPLSTVLSSAYLIEKYVSAEDQPKREKHLQRIVSSVNILTDILNDFLSLGKMEEGKLHAKKIEFDIREMINATLEEMKNNLKEGQRVIYKHEGNARICLDPALLKHIVMNLISNASKFSRDNTTIKVRSANENNALVLSVKDNGIGISKEDQKHLTERFFRGANAGNIQGTGLGLHIVSKYVEMMQGKIKCISQLEKGTTFIITFNSSKNEH
jgi:PAS domain S-box-containing protein